MRLLFRHFWRFVTNKNGPTSVEYAVMLGLIIASLIIMIQTISDDSLAIYEDVSSKLDVAAGGGGKKSK